MKNELLEILRCPKYGVKLKKDNDKLLDDSMDKDIEYPIVSNYPILIDFENSIIDKNSIETLSSVIERNSYHGIKKYLKDIVSPKKGKTIENIEHFIKLVSKDKKRAKVLIVGGGTVGQGINALYNHPNIDIVSFDIYISDKIDFVADAHNIPIADNIFDGVIVQAVLEHVLEPQKVVSEIYRVLKDKGVVYSETPFLQQVHEGAYDFTRFTESGHRYLFKNFELINSGITAGAGVQLLWTIDNFFRAVFRSKKAGKIAKICFFWVRYFDKIIPIPYGIDSASGTFFLGTKSDKEMNIKDIIKHYKGAQ